MNLAPNGKPSNLTPEQYKLVRTPAFKEWFGDWENSPETSSKVVDENGEPMVVYHGSRANFNVFKNNTNDWGFYFTNKKLIAKTYGSKVKEFFLSSKTFELVDMRGGSYEENDEFVGNLIEVSKNNNRDVFLINFIDPPNPEDYKKTKPSDIFVVFNPNQIKLADGTNTTFDSENPDIRFDEGGNVPDEFWGNQAGGVLIICSRTNKVLLLKRSPYVQEPETWGMISGKLDAGESIEEAVAREVKEETGWKIDNLIPSYVFEKNDFTFYNFISLVDIEFTPTLDWENTDYGWFDLNNLPDNLHFGVDILLLKDKYLKGLRYASVEKGLSNLKQQGRNINNKEYQSLVKLRAELEQNRNKYFREGGFLTNSDEIKCYSCNWKWKVKDGGDDLFICHKCYTDNSKFYNLSSEESQEILDTTSYKKGGRTIAQTPAPKKDQIKGSDKNKEGSSKDIKSADKIEFNEKTLTTIKNKVAEHNEKHPNKKVNLPSAKAVVRRGMGAYSSSHRPTISGGKPNSRVAWGLARLNAFIYKIVNGKSKSGKYNQDDDLIKELGYKVKNYKTGGMMQKSELQKGIETEMEHSDTIKKIMTGKYSIEESAELIAKDHLKENDKYYTHLAEMESKFDDGGYIVDETIAQNQIQTPVVGMALMLKNAEQFDSVYYIYQVSDDAVVIGVNEGNTTGISISDLKRKFRPATSEEVDSSKTMNKSIFDLVFDGGGQTPAQQEKIAKVMGEYKRGELNTSYGTKVTDDKQAIAIALSEAGIPKKEEGGVIEGQLHTECNDDSGCGEKFDVGGVGNVIEAERDEAVIVSRAFQDTNRYKVKGTPSQIASALNVMGGGKNFDSGATIYFNGKTIDTNKIKKETNDTDVKDDIESGSVIINRRSMYDDTIYEVEGTPKQIASAINSVNGYGVVIENGATIKEA
jgi:8-oxo-dGTP pyrophosphatase MutT (NUDIX family)